MFPNQLLGVHIQLSRAHARFDGFPQTAKHIIEQRTGLSHAFDLLRIFQVDHLLASSAFRMASLISSSDRSPHTE